MYKVISATTGQYGIYIYTRGALMYVIGGLALQTIDIN